jgi:hypothetical protein
MPFARRDQQLKGLFAGGRRRMAAKREQKMLFGQMALWR